jgi:CRISPR/Cas system CMR-associated protein Cmr1 (group 7 of RAMP superfamily)
MDATKYENFKMQESIFGLTERLSSLEVEMMKLKNVDEKVKEHQSSLEMETKKLNDEKMKVTYNNLYPTMMFKDFLKADEYVQKQLDGLWYKLGGTKIDDITHTSAGTRWRTELILYFDECVDQTVYWKETLKSLKVIL